MPSAGNYALQKLSSLAVFKFVCFTMTVHQLICLFWYSSICMALVCFHNLCILQICLVPITDSFPRMKAAWRGVASSQKKRWKRLWQWNYKGDRKRPEGVFSAVVWSQVEMCSSRRELFWRYCVARIAMMTD